MDNQPGHFRLSPFLATHQHEQRWWMIPLQPLTFLWVGGTQLGWAADQSLPLNCRSL